MIFVRDALLLARTKLRLRIVRLSFTIVTSALLFAALFFAVITVYGSTNSAISFGKEGLGSRFIVSASPATYQSFGPEDKEAVTALTPQYNDLVARKKAAAKALNIQYDPLTDTSLPLTEQKTQGGTTKFINFASTAYNDYLDVKNNAVTGFAYASFQKQAKEYGATQTFRSSGINSSFMSFGMPNSASVAAIINGKEASQNQQQFGQPKGVASITTLGWSQFDDKLLTSFLLPGQDLSIGSDGSIPVVAPMSAVEEMLGLKELSSSATAKERLERLVTVRKDIVDKRGLICYRNGASKALFETATEQLIQIEKNKNTKDFVMPALQYEVSTTPCGPVSVKKDTRSAEEKLATQNDEKFRAQFGEEVAPEQFTVNIRIVGVTSDVDTGSAFSATQIIQSILRSSLGTGWFSPSSMVANDPKLAKVMQTKPIEQLPVSKQQYFAEFATYEQAKKFIKETNCDFGPAEMQQSSIEQAVGFPACVAKGDFFMVQSYGNNAGAIEDFRQGFWNFAKYAGLTTVIFAAIIMMGNLGKIIADSRRETAVFRALGAKRLDIAQIYLTYSVFIAILVSLVAFVIGLLAALFVDSRYSPAVSAQAVLAFNSTDVNKKFALFGFDPKLIGFIIALIFIAALLSTLGPLLSNLRRNPIKDMRDEGV